MTFKILNEQLIQEFKESCIISPLEKLNQLKKEELTVDYFQFYNSVSSVYSSKIEGEEIDFDSYFKHRFLHVKFKPDYTQKADDLYAAYEFIEKNQINLENIKKAHKILSKNLLPKSQQGFIRTNPMFVLNSDDKIEYIAANPQQLDKELAKFSHDLELIVNSNLNDYEIFYYASLLHLVFVKIHPFQDGNGRTARLIEKWFLRQKIGEKAAAIQLEKYYFINNADYYRNIRKIGLEYEFLDYSKSVDFLLMTAKSILK
jgi:Fic family protein